MEEAKVGPATGEGLAPLVRDGIQLFHRRWAHPSPRAGLLIVHGLKDHSGRYAEFANSLAKAGWQVDAFDLRGHGRSTGPRQRIHRFNEYVLDLGAEVSEVQATAPTRPLFLFGHSLGGSIVARFALERRPKVQGIVLSAPALQAPAGVSGFAVGFTKFLSAVAPGAHVLNLRNDQFSRDPAVVAAMAADRSSTRGRFPLGPPRRYWPP